ncbi:ATP synthase F0 subunit B [Thermodesulfobacteriota bacterium]
MNRITNRYLIIVPLILCVAASLILFSSDLFAMEGAGKGRKLWDGILLWFNFAVLVFVFIKFGKNPLMNLLRGEQRKIEKNITTVDEQIKKAKSLMDAEADKLKNIDGHIGKIREDIMEIGRREREKILKKTKITADLMIEDAKKEAQYKLDVAKKRFGEEMLDIAVSIAVEELHNVISQEDNEKIIDQFSIGLKTTNRLSAN